MKTSSRLRAERRGRAWAMLLMLLATAGVWGYALWREHNGTSVLASDTVAGKIWLVLLPALPIACITLMIETMCRLFSDRYIIPGEILIQKVSHDPLTLDRPIPMDPDSPASADLTPQERSLQSVLNHVMETGEPAFGTIDEEGIIHVDEDETPA